MNKKQLEMICFLSIRNRPMNGKEFTGVLKATPRPIKNYVHEINGLYGKGIIASSRNGYELYTNTVPFLLAALGNQKVPQTQEEHSFYIIKQLILHHHSGLDVFNLNGILCVSYSTVKTVIYKVNKVFSAYHIAFPCKNDCVCVQRSEKDKHRLMSYVINEEAKNSYISLGLLRKNFDSINTDTLQAIICQTFEGCTYYLDDFATLNLLLHLLIMIGRELNGKELDSGQTDFTFTSSQGEVFLSSLRQQIERRFGIAFSDYEYFELYMLFHTNANFSLGIFSTTLKNAVGGDVLALTREYVRTVDSLYMTDLSANTFTTPFALHLKNLISRVKTGRSTRNPMTQAIKNNSSIVFDIAIYIALDLVDRYHFMVNEDETAFLTVHIGTEVERQSASVYKIPAILIYPDYRNMVPGVLDTMMMNFGNQLNLIGSMTDKTQCRGRLREQRIVIAFPTILPTQHIYHANSKMVQISLVSLISQLDRIQSIISKKLGEERNQKLYVGFHTFFEKDLFLYEPATTSREQTLQLLCAALTEKKHVNSDFYDSVYRRENAATTAFGGIAIPRAAEMDAMKANIAVAISKDGIQWGSSAVYIIFLLAMNKADKQEFKSIYESLISLFSGPAMIPLIRNCMGLQDFERVIYSSIHSEKYPQKQEHYKTGSGFLSLGMVKGAEA